MLSTEDLGQLDSTEAVQVFRELLWAEATALLIAKNLIDVPDSLTARILHCKTRPRVLCSIWKETNPLTERADSLERLSHLHMWQDVESED
jgi:hypothetical protein